MTSKVDSSSPFYGVGFLVSIKQRPSGHIQRNEKMTELQATCKRFSLCTLDTTLRGLRSDLVRGKKGGYADSWLDRKAEILQAVEEEYTRRIKGATK